MPRQGVAVEGEGISMGSISVRRRVWTAIVGITALLALTASPAAGDMHPFVAPLGLAIGDDGTMYVADAFTGELVAIDRDGARSTIATSDEIAGVDAAGRGLVVYVETLYGADVAATGGGISRVWPHGRTQSLFSTYDFEVEHNPDASTTYGFLDTPQACLDQLPPELAFLAQYDGIVETHPYAIAILPDGGYLVADAAANTILKVAPNGRKGEVVAVLPPVPQEVSAQAATEFGLPACLIGETFYGEPVPTDVEVGPDGHYYVSSLPGAPEAPGAGSVWRIDAGTWAMTQVATGLTFAVDLALEADGTILVAELFGPPSAPGLPGRVVEATAGGPVHVADVPLPGAIEVAADGGVYVTINAVPFFGPPAGDVIRLP